MDNDALDADSSLSRRTLLKGMGAVGAGVAVAGLAGCSSSSKSSKASATTAPQSAATSAPPTTLPGPVRKPGSRPNPTLPEGTDTIPKIEHIVILMMENHSFDDHLGLLGRGDGYKLDGTGQPLDANPDGKGSFVKAFHMPSTCQLPGVPGQDWVRSHTSWNRGKNDGFVKASTAVAMGYWDQTDIPFYYSLANAFPLCDRYFCSVLAQTYPNRRFLMAGTAAGIVSTTSGALTVSPAPNGTIWDRLDAHGITFKNYYVDLPSMDILLKQDTKWAKQQVKADPNFYDDCRKGTLPGVSLVDPNFDSGSEENSSDIRVGEQYAAKIVNAVLQSPAWDKTLLVWTYDEHGGYYDHVPPPRAIRPDNIKPGADVPVTGGYQYDYYGFRVPTVVVSPFAKKDYVSHVVHDHTSILKLIETKWNLGALTYRDANADDMLDSIDLTAPPAFAAPPALAAAGAEGTCTPGKPGGPIPPSSAIVPASEASSLRIGATT